MNFPREFHSRMGGDTEGSTQFWGVFHLTFGGSHLSLRSPAAIRAARFGLEQTLTW